MDRTIGPRWLDSYPPNVPDTFEPATTDLLQAFRTTVAADPDHCVVHHLEHSIGASELDEQSDALATAFHAWDLRRGDRVGVCLQNDPDWLTSLLAAWKAGLAVVPLNPMMREAELERCLVDSDARALVTSREYWLEVASGAIERTGVTRSVTVDSFRCCPDRTPAIGRDDPGLAGTEDLGELLGAGSSISVPPLVLSPDEIALIVYTSGTTGTPKGAMVTHLNLSANAEMTARWFSLTSDDVLLAIAPLFHITGLVVQIAAGLFSGAPLVLFHRFDPAETFRMIELWKPTFSVGAITAYVALMSDARVRDVDISSLVKVNSGGAPVSPAIVERFEAMTGIYIHNCYGLTETSAPVAFTPLGVRAPVDEHSGALSVGLPVPGVSVSFVDPETRSPVPIGEIGELVIEGPGVVAGYWRNLPETEHAMPGGRLYTGDIGFMDLQGWLYIIDRAKDQINASGYKVWPREVEDIIYKHDSVSEVAVVGVPDEYRGETVIAHVVLREGSRATSADVIRFCRERLSAYKCPRRVEFHDQLPKTLTGKILRRSLRELGTVGKREGLG